MADKNHEFDDLRLRGSEGDALDRELDAALAKYAAVHPRTGLEERILASLQTKRTRVTDRPWWHWSIAAVAAVIVVAVALAWRSARPIPPQVVQNRVQTEQTPKQSPHIAADDKRGNSRGVITTGRSARHLQAANVVVAESNPKLDVFPSPRPLSEQEKLLAAFTANSPDAHLMAEARMKMLREDQEDKLRDAADVGRAAQPGR